MSRTMRIKKLTDGSVLERGQLLVVLHCLNRCGSDSEGPQAASTAESHGFTNARHHYRDVKRCEDF